MKYFGDLIMIITFAVQNMLTFIAMDYALEVV